MKTIVALFVLLFSSVLFAQNYPVFSLTPSEYPSWSVFFVAEMNNVAGQNKLIDGRRGKYGPLEHKWKIDIVVIEGEYEACMMNYSSSTADAVCITNMDVLNLSFGRPGTVIMFTSTSYGADKGIVTKDIKDWNDLKKVTTYGLEQSVSQYCTERNLKLAGFDPEKFRFKNQDPGIAAQAMQQHQPTHKSISVWNPFALTTLENRHDVYTLYSSQAIPGEIIDMVVVANDALEREGGERFAALVIDVYYQFCQRMNTPEWRDDHLIALGEKFTNLPLNKMRKVVKETLFYDKIKWDIDAVSGKEVFPFDPNVHVELKQVMKTVVDWCLAKEIIPRKPVIAYDGENNPRANLTFTTKYLKKVQSR